MEAEQVSDRALKWIGNNASRRFFLWLHYFDPHALYTPPEKYLEYEADPYDGEIAYVDDQFGRVIDNLDELDLLDKTLIIVTSDHGEGLGKHGESTHGMFIYDSTMHVPLIVSLPGVLPEGRTVNNMVGLHDIAPTLADLFGTDTTPSMQGSSFLGLIFGETERWKSRPIIMETFRPWHEYGWHPLRAIRTKDRKYIMSPREELYFLDEDPTENNDIMATELILARELRKKLAFWTAKYKKGSPEKQMLNLSQEDM